MRKIVITLLIGFLSFTSFAQEKANENAKHTVTVNGNCKQCKKRIETAALSVKGVKNADWNSRKQELTMSIDETKTDSKAVQKAIAKVGHDTEDFKATKKDYEGLHHCCLYRD